MIGDVLEHLPKGTDQLELIKSRGRLVTEFCDQGLAQTEMSTSFQPIFALLSGWRRAGANEIR
jgi:hypothetical protein